MDSLALENFILIKFYAFIRFLLPFKIQEIRNSALWNGLFQA